MGFLKELLAKQRYPVILLALGGVLFFLGNYSLSGDLGKPHVTSRSPDVIFVVLGIAMIAGSVILFLLDEDFIAYRGACRLSKTETGFRAAFRDSSLHVDFGSLQMLYSGDNSGSVVVLPANDFFDDRCFNDGRTAAGAFIQKHFPPGAAVGLRELVHAELTGKPYESIGAAGESRRSYQAGTCVFLREPCGRPVLIIFAAVARDRQPHGLSTNLGTIFKAVEEIKCIVAEERLSSVYLPVLGSGKGGVPPRIAFQTLVSALLEARCREGGHHLREAHIVVFETSGKDPQVSRKSARRDLRQLVSLYQEMSR
jgi:hypothetical protein